MDDLVQWLGEQLDADERDAEARRGIFPSPAVNDDGSVCLHVRPGGNMAITWYRHPAEGWDDMAKLRNWAAAENGWTQDRVLREIDAKRRIIAEVVPEMNSMTDQIHNDFGVGRMDPATYESLALLRLLALPYADRPGYREEWRPQ